MRMMTFARGKLSILTVSFCATALLILLSSLAVPVYAQQTVSRTISPLCGDGTGTAQTTLTLDK